MKQDCYYCIVVAEMLLSLLLHLETGDATNFLQGLQALPWELWYIPSCLLFAPMILDCYMSLGFVENIFSVHNTHIYMHTVTLLVDVHHIQVSSCNNMRPNSSVLWSDSVRLNMSLASIKTQSWGRTYCPSAKAALIEIWFRIVMYRKVLTYWWWNQGCPIWM